MIQNVTGDQQALLTKVASFSPMASALSFAVDGIDFGLGGNGGPECAASLPWTRRLAEDALAVTVSTAALVAGIKLHKPPPKMKSLKEVHTHEYSVGRIILLVLLAFSYGMEVTYKAATKQMIFLFQPCHMMCLVQLVLLAWPAYSNWLTYLYRVHLCFLQGVIMAVLLPVTNTLFLPGEVFVYWFEHGVLLLVAVYLLRHGGLFTVEKLSDLSWSLMAYGMWGLYHFVLLEGISVTTMANLNCMLCPAITDPIGAPNWRLVAIGHQYLLLLAAGKLFGLIGKGEDDAKQKRS